MFALDTNTLIYYFKDMGNVSENLLQVSPKDIGVPSIVVYELEVGIAKSTSPQKRTQQLKTFLSAVTILPFAEAEAKSAAFIRADLEKQGQPIGPYNVLIAATTLANNATLVTRNTNEFARVQNLQIVDWY
jgi:tRNA(fMet)-specific endonuclease VapC